MALTLAEVEEAQGVFGHLKAFAYDVTFDASYPTGGEELTPATVGLEEIIMVIPEMADTGHIVWYDRANSKLEAWYSDHSESADGPLVEVANTTDLSTVDVRVLIIGF